MPTLLLRRRAEALLERMDDPACDRTLLEATYAQFPVINQLLSGWPRLWRRLLLPALRLRLQAGAEAVSILDVGCGGGDLARRLALFARRDGVPLRVTGIDPDERALDYLARRAHPPGVRFLRADAAALLQAGARFDVVVSNHLLHHLHPPELQALLRDSAALARLRVVHNDIRRSDLALLGYAALCPWLRRSFAAEDGLLSIRRSFTPAELRALAPPTWRLLRLAPYRNVLLWDAPEAER